MSQVNPARQLMWLPVAATSLAHFEVQGADSLSAQVEAGIRQAFCPAPSPAPAATARATAADNRIEPQRVFDNLYFVGDRSTSAWVLATREGIILLDAGFRTTWKARSSRA